MRDKGRSIAKYQDMKSIAVEQEDYEVAKRLKNAIETERRQIEAFPMDGKQWEKSENYRPLDSIQDNLPPR